MNVHRPFAPDTDADPNTYEYVFCPACRRAHYLTNRLGSCSVNVTSKAASVAASFISSRALIPRQHARGCCRSWLLQQPGDPRVPRGRHLGNSAQAADVGCQVRWPLRQAGLRLFAGGGSLSSRGATAISLYEQGGRQTATALLDHSLSKLFA